MVFRICSLDCLGMNITEQIQTTIIQLVAYALLPSSLMTLWLELQEKVTVLMDALDQITAEIPFPGQMWMVMWAPPVPLYFSLTKSFHHRLPTTSVDCQWSIQYLILQRISKLPFILPVNRWIFCILNSKDDKRLKFGRLNGGEWWPYLPLLLQLVFKTISHADMRKLITLSCCIISKALQDFYCFLCFQNINELRLL